MSVSQFGQLADGTPVERVAIAGGGLSASIMTLGAAITDLRVGGRGVVLGFADLASYLAHSPYFGVIAGRHANRIAGGRFRLDGSDVQLECNEGGRNHLHGGARGFARRLWSLREAGPAHAMLALVSEDGDAGYPGRVEASVRYEIPDAGDRLRIVLEAVTDRPTLVNLATHSYFNLDGSPDIGGHLLQIEADAYLPVDGEAIPTGEVRPVAGTPFDFRRLRRIDAHGGDVAHDHNFCLSAVPTCEPRLVARVIGQESGLAMDVLTSEPGLQFYDGYKLAVPCPGLDGRSYGPRAGLCLEPQRWPDSPNHRHFAGAVLRPGELYRQVTEYRFSQIGHEDLTP
ncbi:aldose epimerase family protein [Stappia indica]|uniref:Aldose 1-epimerase n=1 Tax=Stappia indica TaxID=538381 RepID=A0A857CAY3_9HYPH|nr:aldose epimerase family protein [Stappia indica]QGZ36028.1 galactose-1-epimerase [Stappia indica]